MAQLGLKLNEHVVAMRDVLILPLCCGIKGGDPGHTLNPPGEFKWLCEKSCFSSVVFALLRRFLWLISPETLHTCMQQQTAAMTKHRNQIFTDTYNHIIGPGEHYNSQN